MPNNIINWDLCLARSQNDPDTAKQILALFMDDLIELLPTIKQAWLEKDFDTLSSLTHKLYGGSHYCGVPNLAAVLSEFHIRLQDPDSATIEPLMEKFEKASDDLITYYKRDFEEKNHVPSQF